MEWQDQVVQEKEEKVVKVEEIAAVPTVALPKEIPLPSVLENSLKNPGLFSQPSDLPLRRSFHSSINMPSNVELSEMKHLIDDGASRKRRVGLSTRVSSTGIGSNKISTATNHHVKNAVVKSSDSKVYKSFIGGLIGSLSRWFVFKDYMLSYYKTQGPNKILMSLTRKQGSTVISEDFLRYMRKNIDQLLGLVCVSLIGQFLHERLTDEKFWYMNLKVKRKMKDKCGKFLPEYRSRYLNEFFDQVWREEMVPSCLMKLHLRVFSINMRKNCHYYDQFIN